MKKASPLFIFLIWTLGVCVPAFASLPYTGEDYVLLNAQDLKWSPVQSMAPGAEMAVIEGNMSQAEPFTIRLKLPPNYELAPHTHPADERVTVLSGKLYFAQASRFDRGKTTALNPGDMALIPKGEPMFGYTEEETIIQLHGTGPWGINYKDPKDDPRK
jgi:quercetin dioxygenase-like cupin family protein